MTDISNLDLLKKLQARIKNKTVESILPEELDYLVSCFIPDKPYDVRAQAYLTLSLLYDLLKNSGRVSDENSENTLVYQKIRPSLDRRLTEVEEIYYLELLSFHIALFVVDHQSACIVFQLDGYQDNIVDSLEMFPTSIQLQRLLASLVAQACGHKICREHVSPRLISWLESCQAKDHMLRAAIVLAQVKYAQGSTFDASTILESSEAHSDREDLYDSAVDVIIQGGNIAEVSDAIEAIVYLSSSSSIKERIVSHSIFLKRLLSFRPVTMSESAFPYAITPAAAMYGLSVIVENLTAYRWRLSEEERQIEKLKALTKAKADRQNVASADKESHFDDDRYVKERARKLLSAGVVDLLVSIARASDSHATKVTIGKSLLNLAEDSESRGKILQQGGGKTLMVLIRHLFPKTETMQHQEGANYNQSDLFVIQALAKLAITSSPIQVFGPNEEIAYDAIRPFSILLQHQSSTLLQQFEALMALTNLASSGQAAATKIGKFEGLLAKVEFLLLEENVMIRRASMELLCNLIVGSDDIFKRYSGDGHSNDVAKEDAAKSRLHIILALSDVEDVPTRIAASGALATLSASPNTIMLLLLLQKERQRMLTILKQLIDAGIEGWQSSVGDIPSFGLMHRGVICLRNIILNPSDDNAGKEIAVAVEKEHLIESLILVVKTVSSTNETQVILGPIADIVKSLLRYGIVIEIK